MPLRGNTVSRTPQCMLPPPSPAVHSPQHDPRLPSTPPSKQPSSSAAPTSTVKLGLVTVRVGASILQHGAKAPAHRGLHRPPVPVGSRHGVSCAWHPPPPTSSCSEAMMQQLLVVSAPALAPAVLRFPSLSALHRWHLPGQSYGTRGITNYFI